MKGTGELVGRRIRSCGITLEVVYDTLNIPLFFRFSRLGFDLDYFHVGGSRLYRQSQMIRDWNMGRTGRYLLLPQSFQRRFSRAVITVAITRKGRQRAILLKVTVMP